MKRIASVFLAVVIILGILCVPAMAVENTNFNLSAAEVEVDGTVDKTVKVVFSAVEAMSVTGIEGTFSEESAYLTLTDYESPVELSGTNAFSIGTGKVIYADDVNFVGYAVAAGGNVMTAIYTVDKNTPTGEYSVNFEMVDVLDANFASTVSRTYTATISVTNTSGGDEPAPTAEYTITAAAAADEVEVGETVVVDVTVSGAAFNGMEAELNFDASLFELVSVDGIAANYDDTATSSVVELYAAFNNVAYAAGTKVASVTFEAIAEGTAQFTFGDATAGDYEDYRTDAVQATKVGDSVKVNPKTYTITVNPAVNGTVTPNKSEAAAGETITLTVVPDANYELETLTVNDAETTEVNNSTYTFVMPDANVTVTATFKAKAVVGPWDDIADKTNYVSGVTLVTVTGNSVKGYTYDGKAMYKVADGEFAYLVEGAADTTKVAEAASAGYDDLSGAKANDVNGTDIVDFNDAGAAFGCYNKAYDVVADMAMYLRADVNGDSVVDADDVNVILGAY